MRTISCATGRPSLGLWMGLLAAGSVAALSCRAPEGQGLIATGAEIVKLAGDFQWAEGPVQDSRGDILFCDVFANKLYKWSPSEAKTSVVREDSGGAIGLSFDGTGTLIICEWAARRIGSISPAGEYRVIAGRYQGKRLNGPNDLWVDPEGGIYFTDPAYKGRAEEIQHGRDAVYYLSPDRDGIVRVADDLARPNGVVGTADGRTLYVVERHGRKIWRYQIQPDGTLGGKTLFIKAIAGGLALDEDGRVYLTNVRDDRVEIYSPEGKRLESVRFPDRPTNLCFGGPDNRTLFITTSRSLYSLAMAVRGRAGVPRP